MIDLGTKKYNYTKYKVMIGKNPRRMLLLGSCCCLFLEPSGEDSNVNY